MQGNTSAERLKRLAEIEGEKDSPGMEYDAKRVTVWLDNTPHEAEWMAEEIERSNVPGHIPWDYINELGQDGKTTGRVGLARVG